MTSKKAHEGYLLIDHRASPGLPKGFYDPLGIDAPTVGEGQVAEMATITCSHCKNIFIINPLRNRERAYCAKCDHYICDICKGISLLPAYVHTPFDKIVDAVKSEQNVTLLLANLKGN